VGALLFLIGLAVGALLNAIWDDVLELLELFREQR
jgi:hypothetical protein